MNLNKIFLILKILIFKISLSQTSNISLEYLNIFDYNNQVFVEITLSPGNTCNGIKLLRSKDSINFEEIFFIDGVCGNSSLSSNYNLIDSTPILNTLNYYKVQFGTNFFSDIYEIFILNFRDSNFQIWPNPANYRTTIFFQNNLSELYLFNLYNLSGEKLLSISTNENNIQLDCTIYYSGIYFFTLAQENNNFYKSGKMIINHL